MTATSSPRRDDILVVVAGVASAALVGFAGALDIRYGVLLLATILIGLVLLARPVILAVVAGLCVFAVQRVGAGSSNGISVSDVALALATSLAVPSLVLGPELRRLRGPLIGLGCYLLCLLPAVVTDDSLRGWVEWVHRLVIVGGAMLVGAWIARERLTRVVLRGLLTVALIVATAAVVTTFQTGFDPAYPLGLQKNFAGAQIGMLLLLVLVVPKEFALPRALRLVSVLVLVGGLLATQSRGSMLAAGAGALFFVALQPRAQTRQARGLVVLSTLVLLVFTYLSIRSQLSLSTADLRNSSIGIRRQVEARTIQIWRTSPWHGVGLKYFNSGTWGPLAAPPNIVVDNELAESGLLGLAGFVVLQFSAIRAGVARRRESVFAIAGAACVLALLTHGLVDIYWIAGSATLPFLVLGMSLGADSTAGVAPRPRERGAHRVDA
jgi:hypothetical protein